MGIRQSSNPRGEDGGKIRMKKSMRKKGWDIVSLFMILLIVMLPFYTAEALAVSVDITKNSGEAGIDNYLDGKGDVWTLEATIGNVPNGTTIAAESVDITLGGNTDTMDTCSQSSSGYVCKYQSDLSSGAVEDRYNLQVLYRPTGEGDPGLIVVDSSVPEITKEMAVSQNNQGKITLDFAVEDKPAFGVGLGKIEIIDVDSGTVLQTIQNFSARQMAFDYRLNGGLNGLLQAPSSYYSGAEDRRVQLRVEDRFGHRRVGLPIKLSVDFINPSIVSGSLNFTDLNGFIGPSSELTSMTIDIQENSELSEVSAFSDKISIPDDNLADTCVVIGENLQRCTWYNVRVESVDSLTVQVTAKDRFQNTVEGSLAFTFARDVQPPVVEFFGTERVFADVSYLSGERPNKVIMRINEVGAGITRDDVIVDFNNLGYSDEPGKIPDYCERNSTFVCVWENIEVQDIGSDRDVELRIVRLRDLVGNEGDHSSYHLRTDSTPPPVNRLEILAVNDLGEHDHFQAEDKLLVKLNISEPAGIFFRINLNDVIMGADSLYPATEFHEAGWQEFTQDSCVRTGTDWVCEFLVSRGLKSEYQGNAVIELELEDTAGNVLPGTRWPEEFRSRGRSSNNRFFFQKLALDEDQHPDYWAINPAQIRPKIPFVDIETTEFVSTRMAFDVEMRASSPTVSALRVELVGCDSDFPSQGRQVLWNNIYPEPDLSPTTFNLVLEFLPFNAREYFKDKLVGENFQTTPVEFSCTFNIYSKVGRKAVRAAETETVKVSVPFGFSELGSEDEALEELIAREKEAVRTGWWGALGTINTILKIIKYFVAAAQLVLGIFEAVDLAYGIVDKSLVGFEANPASRVPIQIQRFTYCLSITSTEHILGEVAQTTQGILGVFTCSNTPCGDEALWEVKWDEDWWQTLPCIVVWTYNSMSKLEQETIHGTFEFEKDTFIPNANTVYDNIYLSIGSFCITGIFHNLDKLRQIQCRYIDCLETEVSQGLATVQACGKLKDVLECKYFYGPLFQLIPFVGAFWSNFLDSLSSLLTDPVAWVTTTLIIGCAIQCVNAFGGVPTMSEVCRWIHFGMKVLGIIDNAWGTTKSIIQEVEGGADYCSRVLDEEEEEPTEVVTGEDTTVETEAPEEES